MEFAIPFTPARGVFQHAIQVQQHKTNPEPSDLCLGNLVCVWADSPEDGLPPHHLGFRLGTIVRVYSTEGNLDVQWLVTGAGSLTLNTQFRVWAGQVKKSTLKVSDCFFTFRALTSTGRIQAQYRLSIVYIMDCRVAIAAHESVPVAPALSNSAFDEHEIGEYLADHVIDEVKVESVETAIVGDSVDELESNTGRRSAYSTLEEQYVACATALETNRRGEPLRRRDQVESGSEDSEDNAGAGAVQSAQGTRPVRRFATFEEEYLADANELPKRRRRNQY